MSDFERDVVQCLNRLFEEHHIRGFAYRLKQHKFSSQYVDVLSDSLDPRYYLAIECKSIKDRKLYFSQHFHNNREQIHQIDLITSFLERTGRRGYLAIEFRFGSGRMREAYLVPWKRLLELYRTTQGIDLETARGTIALGRSGEAYRLNPEVFESDG